MESSPFIQAFSMLIAIFKSIIKWLDSIILFGSTSILELVIVLGLMGTLISVLLPVLANNVAGNPATQFGIANAINGRVNSNSKAKMDNALSRERAFQDSRDVAFWHHYSDSMSKSERNHYLRGISSSARKEIEYSEFLKHK